MATHTKGLEATRRAMVARDMKTQKVLAERTGIDEAKISRILHAKALPNRKEAVALRDELGVDPGMWDQELPTEPDTEVA
jgi:transcriptional regulator with XRE-family HTH domain